MKWYTKEKYSMCIMESEDDENAIEIIKEVCNISGIIILMVYIYGIYWWLILVFILWNNNAKFKKTKF